MKKLAAGAGATAVALAGLSGLSIAPAAASPFENCTQARQAGVTDIRIGDPNYAPHLDSRTNPDGVACESEGGVGLPDPVSPQTPEVNTPQAPQAPRAPEAPVTADPAAQEPWTWDNCSEAFANGVSNIPAGAPGYGTHLDRDLDGIGCELNGDDDAAFPTPVVADDVDDAYETDGAADQVSADPAAEGSQVAQVPTGGAETGVPVQESSPQAGVIGLSALALGAAAGAGLLVRRAVRA